MNHSHLKEHVDFQEKIGTWIDKSGSGLNKQTTKGIIHYSKAGAHIVPSNPHTDGKFNNLGFIRSSIQVALLGNITANLRAVSLELQNNQIKLIFFFYEKPTEEEEELSSLVHTEFLADFPFSTFTIQYELITISALQSIPKQDILVYLRYERS